jgi:preprotein translocase SecF subunit
VFDIIGKRNWFFALSLAIVVPGLIFIILGPITGGGIGIKFAIDFTGGTVWRVQFDDASVNADQVKSVLSGHTSEVQVSQVGAGTSGQQFIEIRIKDPSLAIAPAPTATPAPSASASAGPSGSAAASAAPSGSAAASGSPAPSASTAPSPSSSASAAPSASAAAAASAGASAAPSPSASTSPAYTTCTSLPGTSLPALCGDLESQLGHLTTLQVSSVGAVVSSDLITQALVLILAGSIGILLWITYRFRDFRMGVCALISLLHDVIVVVGLFAIFGTFFGLQIDSLFVTAMLTIIGFSVHDTIVVFDRIRENRSRHAGEPFDRIVNHSILQTFGRSVTTSFTVVITLLALLLFAGQAIGTFVLALLIGIISGTYSSIFNASPLLVVWHLWDEKKRLSAETAARPGRRATT